MTDPGSDDDDQLALVPDVRAPAPLSSPDRFAGAAPGLPVARVAVDVSLAHLDRPFDYVVPEDLDESVVPGCRVTVRFAGKQANGFVLERLADSEHTGRLGRIGRVVSSEVVLRPEVARLCREVADRYAGTFADVVRLAVPPRHARTEKRAVPDGGTTSPLPAPARDAWADYPGGAELLEQLGAGESPRAVWSPVPGRRAQEALVAAVAAVLASGRGAVVCLPDVADVERLDAAMTAAWGTGRHVVLTADLGPAARYAAFLELARGRAKVAVGTRAAAFAPVSDLGLVAIFDDGDDLFAEPRAPYPHARETLLTRAWDSGCAVLVGGWARTAEAQQLVRSGWCVEIGAPVARRRGAWARVEVDDQAGPVRGSRLPSRAFRVLRDGLEAGPVLVQVPRTGYRSALACQQCRTPARCVRCSGPLQQADPSAVPACRWCGSAQDERACPVCGSTRLRAPVVGDRRTTEELGRAFPRVRVRSVSGGSGVRAVDSSPEIVVATPGAEPVAEGGYAAAVLLDAWVTLSRPDLRTEEEALRRWLNAVALVRGHDDGGRAVVVADPALPVVQALVRADAGGFAERELDARSGARLPPAVRLAAIEGPGADLAALAAGPWPEPAQVLGPVESDRRRDDDDRDSRLVVVAPRSLGGALARRLQQAQAERSVRKVRPLRIQVDPAELG